MSRRDNVEPVESALYRELVDLVDQRTSSEQFALSFDSEILALLVEEGEESILIEPEKSSLSETYAHVRSVRHQANFAKFATSFSAAAAVVAEQNPEATNRTLFSGTGLSSLSCRMLKAKIEEMAKTLRGILESANTDQIDGLVDAIIPLCLELPEMMPDNTFGGSNIDLLKAWIRGTSMPNILKEFGSQSQTPENLGRFIEDLFGYKLPWGISAFLRIAQAVLAEHEIGFSTATRFFASMVKYGLPDPVACWAMTSGVPFRSAAMSMASTFRRNNFNLSHETFSQWLFRQSSEELLNEYGIKGPFLGRLARALQTAGSNPLLSTLATLGELLPKDFEVRGIAYETRRAVAQNITAGMHLQVERDYDNLHDRNAVFVKLGASELGYLPKALSQLVAPEMDLGIELAAVVSRVELGTIPRVFADLVMR
jgi:hypothetical protein